MQFFTQVSRPISKGAKYHQFVLECLGQHVFVNLIRCVVSWAHGKLQAGPPPNITVQTNYFLNFECSASFKNYEQLWKGSRSVARWEVYAGGLGSETYSSLCRSCRTKIGYCKNYQTLTTFCMHFFFFFQLWVRSCTYLYTVRNWKTDSLFGITAF